MAELNTLLNSGGDEAKELLKQSLLEQLASAKSDMEVVVKDTASKTEQWLKMCAAGEIDSVELKSLLEARRRTVEQFLNSQEIEVRARLEKLTLGLIDLVLNRVMSVLL